MNGKQICTIYQETAKYADRDAYISDLALSSIFLPPEDQNAEIDMETIEQLRTLWDIAHSPFKDLLQMMGLTQTQCATRFCIPLRTVQGWAGEERVCSPYIRLMMAELSGLIKLRD